MTPKAVRQYLASIGKQGGKKGGPSLKGTEAAKIRSAKANAAKKAKRDKAK